MGGIVGGRSGEGREYSLDRLARDQFCMHNRSLGIRACTVRDIG